MKKARLDLLMTSRGLAPSREKARALIMAGAVLVDGERRDKAGDFVPESCEITVREKLPFVSRGGLKLQKALEIGKFSLKGAVCMDIGASTGGFTDCMLQHGAAKVYAVDVGYGQLAWQLRKDPRVKNLERTNARYLTREQIPEPIDFASVDVSFISLRLILPVLYRLLGEGAQVAALIKPQFEAGKGQVGKKGVVRDPAVHRAVLHEMFQSCTADGFAVGTMDFSPIKGPEGNIEYLFLLQKDGAVSCLEAQIDALVGRSHEALNARRD